MNKNKPVEIEAVYSGQRVKSNLTLYEHLIVEIAKSLTKRSNFDTDWIANDTVAIVNRIFDLTENK